MIKAKLGENSICNVLHSTDASFYHDRIFQKSEFQESHQYVKIILRRLELLPKQALNLCPKVC